jgi:hypothetical protein
MKSCIVKAKQADGTLGIRTRVWLIVFGMLLLCVFAIRLSPTRIGPAVAVSATSSADAKRQDSPARPHAIARRNAFKYSAPDEVHQSRGARSDAGDQLFEMALSDIAQTIEDRHSWIDPR